MKKKLILASLLGLVLALAMGSTAALASPPHGPEGHSHHVHLGNGECVDIDTVLFNGEHRGLHHGSSESGHDNGPWHGTNCDH